MSTGADSYGGCLPPSYYGTWLNPLAPYVIAADAKMGASSDWRWYADGMAAGASVKNSLFGRCPSLAESPYVKNSAINTSVYGLNLGGPSHFNFAPETVQRKITQFKRPSTTLAFADAAGSSSGKTTWYIGCPLCGSATIADPRHIGGANMALFDGHVEWQRPLYFSGNANDLWLHTNRIQ